MRTRRQSQDPLEFYETPPSVTRALMHVGPVRGDRVIEPMAGANAITNVLRDEAQCDVTAYDIAPRGEGIIYADSLVPGFLAERRQPHLTVVTNPAFSLAAELWRQTRTFTRVALLVRITWLERCKDREDVADPVRLIVLPRVKFTGKGSDSATVVWACWGDWPPGIVRLTRSDLKALEQPIRAEVSA